MKNITFYTGGIFVLLVGLLFGSCSKNDETTDGADFRLTTISVNGVENKESYIDVDPLKLTVVLSFSGAVDSKTIEKNIQLKDKSNSLVKLRFNYTDASSVIHLYPESSLNLYSKYTLVLSPGLKSADGVAIFTGKTYAISTSVDTTDKFERIPYEDLLTLVQNKTFGYFWNFGHPTSGMARERSTSGDVVTTGGTGFGIMAMVVAAERGFISRDEALLRIQKIVTFLDTKCSKYHGAFSHWINGSTGATVPFSQYDDGADLVETALLFQGLLTAQRYFDNQSTSELKLRNDIKLLWEAVDWTWFQKGGENVLYWHWSPNYGWQMNLKISGWNEALIVYVLAASSPTHPISKNAYQQGWARNGAFANGKSFYGYSLPLGEDYGGPLFFGHYSFLGINPKGLKDQYADYWLQNRNQSLVNYNYCVANPKNYPAYGYNCWGLTACDENGGYDAHSPTNDKGVIAPTAALSSMPYMPEQSKAALEFFYYKLGDKLWKDYGFVDAFDLTQQWFSSQHLAIDQGPIVIMIENYRSGLLWNQFMSHPDVKNGLQVLGFEISPL
jgi:hypothetical protein